MNLYDFSPGFFPRIPAALSKAACVWCLGAIVWMGAGLFLFLLSFLRTGPCSGWGDFCLALNPGILRQTALVLLVYGWGVPMMMGVSLLKLGQGGSFDFSWVRAGAWGWHGILFIGTVFLLGGQGSGISVMPFPLAVWPGLVLAGGTVSVALLSSLMGGGGKWSLRDKLVFMTAFLGLLYLLGGTVSVFLVSLPPYYRTMAAECTTYGMAVGILCSFALVLLLPARMGKGYVRGTALGWVILMISQSCLFFGARPGMEMAGLVDISFCSGWLVFFCFVLSLRKSSRLWAGAVGILWGGWYFLLSPAFLVAGGGERAGAWMVYCFLLMFGVFAIASALALYVHVPRCTGRDWLSRTGLFVPLCCWLSGVVVLYVGVLAVDSVAGRFASFYWRAHSWTGIIALFLFLSGWCVFALHVFLVWTGKGRIADRSLFGEEELSEFLRVSDKEKQKGGMC